MYEVIHMFKDLQDENEHIYKVGKEFPYDGRKITKKRITELSTSKNVKGYPVIKKIEEEIDKKQDIEE